MDTHVCAQVGSGRATRACDTLEEQFQPLCSELWATDPSAPELRFSPNLSREGRKPAASWWGPARLAGVLSCVQPGSFLL